MPCPVPSGYAMRDISRFEVPVLEATRFDARELLRMEAWNGARALFLSVPFQARKRDDSRKGRMSTRTLSYVVAKIADHAQVDDVHRMDFDITSATS